MANKFEMQNAREGETQRHEIIEFNLSSEELDGVEAFAQGADISELFIIDRENQTLKIDLTRLSERRDAYIEEINKKIMEIGNLIDSASDEERKTLETILTSLENVKNSLQLMNLGKFPGIKSPEEVYEETQRYLMTLSLAESALSMYYFYIESEDYIGELEKAEQESASLPVTYDVWIKNGEDASARNIRESWEKAGFGSYGSGSYGKAAGILARRTIEEIKEQRDRIEVGFQAVGNVSTLLTNRSLGLDSIMTAYNTIADTITRIQMLNEASWGVMEGIRKIKELSQLIKKLRRETDPIKRKKLMEGFMNPDEVARYMANTSRESFAHEMLISYLINNAEMLNIIRNSYSSPDMLYNRRVDKLMQDRLTIEDINANTILDSITPNVEEVERVAPMAIALTAIKSQRQVLDKVIKTKNLRDDNIPSLDRMLLFLGIKRGDVEGGKYQRLSTTLGSSLDNEFYSIIDEFLEAYVNGDMIRINDILGNKEKMERIERGLLAYETINLVSEAYRMDEQIKEMKKYLKEMKEVYPEEEYKAIENLIKRFEEFKDMLRKALLNPDMERIEYLERRMNYLYMYSTAVETAIWGFPCVLKGEIRSMREESYKILTSILDRINKVLETDNKEDFEDEERDFLEDIDEEISSRYKIKGTSPNFDTAFLYINTIAMESKISFIGKMKLFFEKKLEEERRRGGDEKRIKNLRKMVENLEELEKQLIFEGEIVSSKKDAEEILGDDRWEKNSFVLLNKFYQNKNYENIFREYAVIPKWQKIVETSIKWFDRASNVLLAASLANVLVIGIDDLAALGVRGIAIITKKVGEEFLEKKSKRELIQLLERAALKRTVVGEGVRLASRNISAIAYRVGIPIYATQFGLHTTYGILTGAPVEEIGKNAIIFFASFIPAGKVGVTGLFTRTMRGIAIGLLAYDTPEMLKRAYEDPSLWNIVHAAANTVFLYHMGKESFMSAKRGPFKVMRTLGVAYKTGGWEEVKRMANRYRQRRNLGNVDNEVMELIKGGETEPTGNVKTEESSATEVAKGRGEKRKGRIRRALRKPGEVVVEYLKGVKEEIKQGVKNKHKRMRESSRRIRAASKAELNLFKEETKGMGFFKRLLEFIKTVGRGIRGSGAAEVRIELFEGSLEVGDLTEASSMLSWLKRRTGRIATAEQYERYINRIRKGLSKTYEYLWDISLSLRGDSVANIKQRIGERARRFVNAKKAASKREYYVETMEEVVNSYNKAREQFFRNHGRDLFEAEGGELSLREEVAEKGITEGLVREAYGILSGRMEIPSKKAVEPQEPVMETPEGRLAKAREMIRRTKDKVMEPVKKAKRRVEDKIEELDLPKRTEDMLRTKYIEVVSLLRRVEDRLSDLYVNITMNAGKKLGEEQMKEFRKDLNEVVNGEGSIDEMITKWGERGVKIERYMLEEMIMLRKIKEPLVEYKMTYEYFYYVTNTREGREAIKKEPAERITPPPEKVPEETLLVRAIGRLHYKRAMFYPKAGAQLVGRPVEGAGRMLFSSRVFKYGLGGIALWNIISLFNSSVDPLRDYQKRYVEVLENVMEAKHGIEETLKGGYVEEWRRGMIEQGKMDVIESNLTRQYQYVTMDPEHPFLTYGEAVSQEPPKTFFGTMWGVVKGTFTLWKKVRKKKRRDTSQEFYNSLGMNEEEVNLVESTNNNIEYLLELSKALDERLDMGRGETITFGRVAELLSKYRDALYMIKLIKKTRYDKLNEAEKKSLDKIEKEIKEYMDRTNRIVGGIRKNYGEDAEKVLDTLESNKDEKNEETLKQEISKVRSVINVRNPALLENLGREITYRVLIYPYLQQAKTKEGVEKAVEEFTEEVLIPVKDLNMPPDYARLIIDYIKSSSIYSSTQNVGTLEELYNDAFRQGSEEGKALELAREGDTSSGEEIREEERKKGQKDKQKKKAERGSSKSGGISEDIF